MRLAGFLLLTIFFVGCKSTKTVQQTQKQELVLPCQEITIHSPDIRTPIDPSLTIASERILGDCLELEVNYSGCETDQFELIFNGLVAKSLPPKTTLVLKKEAVLGCGALRSKTLRFDLTKLKRGETTGKIELSLGKGTTPLLYSY